MSLLTRDAIRANIYPAPDVNLSHIRFFSEILLLPTPSACRVSASPPAERRPNQCTQLAHNLLHGNVMHPSLCLNTGNYK